MQTKTTFTLPVTMTGCSTPDGRPILRLSVDPAESDLLALYMGLGLGRYIAPNPGHENLKLALLAVFKATLTVRDGAIQAEWSVDARRLKSIFCPGDRETTREFCDRLYEQVEGRPLRNRDAEDPVTAYTRDREEAYAAVMASADQTA